MKELFGGEGSEQYNAVLNVILECGKDYAKHNKVDDIDYAHYEWLEETPKTSLTVEFVKKLNELGFQIIKTKQP